MTIYIVLKVIAIRNNNSNNIISEIPKKPFKLMIWQNTKPNAINEIER